MAVLGLSPSWFSGYDVILEVVFAIITMAVSLYAYKVYKLSDQRQSKLFSVSFFLISLSYLVLAITNLLVILRLADTDVDSVLKFLTKTHLAIMQILDVYVYIILFLFGLLTLAYMTLSEKNGLLYFLLAAILSVSFVLTAQIGYFFNIIASVFLGYVVIFYARNYIKKKQKNTLMSLSAFSFLFIGRVSFIFSPIRSIFYPIAHFLEFIAYIIILVSLIIVLRK